MRKYYTCSSFKIPGFFLECGFVQRSEENHCILIQSSLFYKWQHKKTLWTFTTLWKAKMESTDGRFWHSLQLGDITLGKTSLEAHNFNNL